MSPSQARTPAEWTPGFLTAGPKEEAMAMFNLFKKKAPPLELVVKDFQQGQLELTSPKVLTPGPLQAVLKLPQGEADVAAQITVDSGLDDQLLYWAALDEPKSLEATLLRLFPPMIEPDNAATFEEKRSQARFNKVLGILSRDLPGFKTVSFDLTNVGVRIAVDAEVPVGKSIAFKLDLDDARIPPLDVNGTVLWCRAKDPKGFWIGVKFTAMSEANQAILDKFLDEARNVEHGVITRDYAAD